MELHEYEAFRDLHGRELLKAVELPLWKVPQVMNDMRKRMAEEGAKLSLFEAIDDVLQRLSGAGLQIAIVSSNSRANVERILGPHNAKLINQFNCGASLFGKASKIKAVIRTSKVSAEETIYIGDEVRDAEAAREAGIAYGAVTWGQHREERLRRERPDHVFKAVEEIATKLCG